jgi:hypothetical protein
VSRIHFRLSSVSFLGNAVWTMWRHEPGIWSTKLWVSSQFQSDKRVCPSSRYKEYTEYMKAVCEVRGLTLLHRVGTSWRCGDGLFFEVPPLASDTLLTTLHPLLENVLQTVDHFEIFCLGAPFSWLEKPSNRMGRDLN